MPHLTDSYSQSFAFYRYSLELSDVSLHVPICTMTQEMFVRFNSTIQKKAAIYGLRRSMIIPHTIPADATFYFNDSLFVASEQPTRFGLAFVKAQAFHGSYT